MTSLTRFETLALPQMDAAYQLAFWILRSREDAEDVVQEAFLSAFRAFDDLRGEDAKPWLLAITRNAAYRRLSERRRDWNVVPLDAGAGGDRGEPGPALDLPDPSPSVEEALISASDRDLVRRALADLPPAYREVLALREMEGLDYRSIAAVTGAVIGTVMSRLARGRKELRAGLARLMEKESVHDQ